MWALPPGISQWARSNLSRSWSLQGTGLKVVTGKRPKVKSSSSSAPFQANAAFDASVPSGHVMRHSACLVELGLQPGEQPAHKIMRQGRIGRAEEAFVQGVADGLSCRRPAKP